MDLVSIVVTVGVPVLAAVFYLEGLLIGKLLQAPWVFVGYVTVTTPSLNDALLVVATCAVAATFGQWTLYRWCHPEAQALLGGRLPIPSVDVLSRTAADRAPDRLRRLLGRWFDRHAGLAICVTNALPLVRGLLTVPAGLSAYPRWPFLVASTIGNVLYVLLYLGVAWGLLEVVRALFG